MINLIPRFFDVSRGSILVDGVDIRDVKQHDLCEKIGYVPQKGVLFSGTIESNLKYGKEDATIDEVKRAARIAQATDFIEEKEEKYDSPIAQGGSNVSGGQKQRLSIARAIAKDPEIYIFDDSFSALDYKTDVKLRSELQKETNGSTTLIVAQRISTILHADQIIVLDEGNIVGKGTHEELLNTCPVYQQIAKSQLSEDDLKKAREVCLTMSNNRRRGPMGGPGRGMAPGEKAKDLKGTMVKLIKYMRRFYVPIVMVIIFAIASTVFNIVGPTILGDATTEIFKGLVHKVSGGSGIDFDKVTHILLMLLSLYVASAIFSFIQGLIMTHVSNNVSYQMRKDISEKIHRMPMKYFESRTYGEVLSRVTNDVDTLGQSLIQSMTQIITSATQIVGVFIMMIRISIPMTIAVLLTLPLSMGLIGLIMSKSQPYFKAQQKHLGELNGQVEEIYSGHNIVKAFNKEESVIEEFKEVNGKLYNSAWRSQFFSGAMMPLMQFVGNLGYVAVTILGGYLAIKKTIEVGQIQSFLQYVRNFSQPITQLAQVG